MQKVFQEADILLPIDGIDMNRWAVVACDQYTSEQEYWEEAEAFVGQEPSTLDMILPEVYLDRPDTEERLDRIHQAMEKYERDKLFQCLPQTMIYIERKDSSGNVRQGLMGCVDLEYYDYSRDSGSPVRGTEATVPSRLPARVRIREGALLELPHIMLLIDDDARTVIEPLAAMKDRMKTLYNFDLMLGGGHLTGYQLEHEEIHQVLSALDRLGDREAFTRKYQAEGHPVLTYAVGDGNHSLAAARLFYETMKAAEPDRDFSGHPARYALVELVNLHSPALEFQPIHRIVKGVDVEKMMADMRDQLDLTGPIKENEEGVDAAGKDSDVQSFVLVRKGRRSRYVIGRKRAKLTVGSLQRFLDSWCDSHGGEIDYIHGEDVLETLSMEEDAAGFLLPGMEKSQLFPTVIFDGALPRKTFSMGHAQDKRYYVECRRITEK